jgi:hypothetical protein
LVDGMSLTEKELYPEVRNALRRWYPQHRGWKIIEKEKLTGIRPDFLMERNVGGRTERSICNVETIKTIDENHITKLQHYADGLSGTNITMIEKILAVPAGTDTSSVPGGITVLVVHTVAVH